MNRPRRTLDLTDVERSGDLMLWCICADYVAALGDANWVFRGASHAEPGADYRLPVIHAACNVIWKQSTAVPLDCLAKSM